MKSKKLRPGDVFTVEPRDSESPLRVCLTNDPEHGLRFGFPGRQGFWSYMGDEVEVGLPPETEAAILMQNLLQILLSMPPDELPAGVEEICQRLLALGEES